MGPAQLGETVTAHDNSGGGAGDSNWAQSEPRKLAALRIQRCWARHCWARQQALQAALNMQAARMQNARMRIARIAAAAVRLQAACRGNLAREDVKHALLVFNGAQEARIRLSLLHARGISWAEWQMGRRRAQRRRRERDAAISSHHTPPTTSLPAAPSVHAGCNVSHLTVGALGVMNEVEDRDRRANFLTRALSVEHPAVLPPRIGYAEAAAAAMTAAVLGATPTPQHEQQHQPQRHAQRPP